MHSEKMLPDETAIALAEKAMKLLKAVDALCEQVDALCEEIKAHLKDSEKTEEIFLN